MRKIISLILVSILLMNLLGGPAYFAVQLICQQRAMRTLIASTPKDQLTRIVLTVSDFENVQVEEHELLLQGKMFDIGLIERQETHVVVYGLFDVKENDLLASIRKQSTQQTENSASNQVITRFVCMHYLIEHFQPGDLHARKVTAQFDARPDSYKQISAQPTNPPPENRTPRS